MQPERAVPSTRLTHRPGLLVLSGEMAVPQSRENATNHVVRALVGGAVGPGLRIVRRDGDELAFVSSTLSARLLGAGSGRISVTSENGRTVARYHLSVVEGVFAAGLVGFGVALGTAAALSERGLPTSLGVAVPTGLAAAAGLAALVVRRTRSRFDALLHNLRYVS